MNKIFESAMIALDAIWSSKLRSLMTVLGNIVAVTSIIAVVSLIQGLNASVKEAILKKFGSLQPNQFSTAGMGWDRPADPSDPDNNAKNRRVEVKVYPAEAAPAK